MVVSSKEMEHSSVKYKESPLDVYAYFGCSNKQLADHLALPSPIFDTTDRVKIDNLLRGYIRARHRLNDGKWVTIDGKSVGDGRIEMILNEIARDSIAGCLDYNDHEDNPMIAKVVPLGFT